MTLTNTQSPWNVSRATAACAACNQTLAPNMQCWAALCDRPPALSPAEEPPKSKNPKDNKEDAPSPFIRLDFCDPCWSQGKRPENLPTQPAAPPLTMFSFWKTTIPTPQQKKKLLVDDSVLIDVFQRLENRTEPQEIRFRFVLALILMRKRLLKYEGMNEIPPATTQSPPAETPETWQMLPRGQQSPIAVINPHLTPEQITEVSQQLSTILAEEL